MTVFFISNRSVHWNYCVLDEGHIIKNGKTKARYLVTEYPQQR